MGSFKDGKKCCSRQNKYFQSLRYGTVFMPQILLLTKNFFQSMTIFVKRADHCGCFLILKRSWYL